MVTLRLVRYTSLQRHASVQYYRAAGKDVRPRMQQNITNNNKPCMGSGQVEVAVCVPSTVWLDEFQQQANSQTTPDILTHI